MNDNAAIACALERIADALVARLDDTQSSRYHNIRMDRHTPATPPQYKMRPFRTLIDDWIDKNCPHLSREDGYHEYQMWADSKFVDELSNEEANHDND